MTMWRRAATFLLSAAMLFALAGPAAARTVVPSTPPPLPGGPAEIQLESLQASATVSDGVAHVRMDQRFVNHGRAPAEGTYIFPLPQGASVSSFQMFVDGQAYTGEVLDADKARAVYESIVRRNRDPALLQYIGQGLLQARVFPVPPGAERLIRVEYEQVLPRDGGLWELNLPLDDEAIPQASVTVDLQDAGNGTIYSPTHTVAVTRHVDGSARASFEGAGVRGTFRLYFGKESDDLGVSLLTYKGAGEDGYFLLLVNPPAREQAEVAAKDVLLVIDLSGSMSGEKFEQAKGAALQILGSLGRDDRFAVIGFHSDTVTYADELRGASDVADAMEFVRGLKLGGATNIGGAMSRAQQIAGQATSRPQVIILLTDGQPTAGETDPDRIIAGVRGNATASLRIFTFGIGYDVNTVLLDSLAQENRGRSDYVKPSENLEAAVGAFWRKVGQPLLTDVTLAWGGAKVDQVYPRAVPDLYLGSQMVLLGRYRGAGEAQLVVSGKVNGEVRSYSFPGLRFADNDTGKDYIPRLWANRKVGDLLSEVRRNGTNQELLDEIVALSQRFGIATPYTSFFVNEPGAPVPMPAMAPDGAPTGMPQAPMPSQTAANKVAQSMAAAPASGPTAVDSAKKVEQIRGAESLAQAQGGAADQIRTAGAKTFILRGGIWTDTAYQGGELHHLKLGSDRYLELVRTRPDLARYLAVGAPLILVDGAVAYGIDIPGKEESEGALPAPPQAAAGGGPGAGAGRSGPGAVALWLGGGAGAGALALLGLWIRRRQDKRTA